MKRLAIAASAFTLILTSTVPAHATVPSTKEIKAYAQGYVTAKGGERQWKCFYRVINYESRWNHRAVNGRYYGLGQMANAKPRHVGKPYLQIRDAWKYMVHRYDGKACGAWSHIERVGWY